MLAWAALAVPLHLVISLAGRPHAVPPMFLCGIGRIAGLRLRFEGRPLKHALLLGNHLSWLDVMALATAARTAFVAHSGLAGHPVLKWLCEQNGTVFITRDRRRTVTGQVEQVRDALRERSLAIFPEGTTGDGRELLPFKSALLSAVGALPADIPVQPVALSYEQPQEIAWGAEESGLANAAKILGRLRPVHLTVHFLDPLAGPALADRKAMAAEARAAIDAVLPSL